MEQIQSGKQAMPPRIMVYGTEGIGKSTLAAQAPKPIFIQTEDGLSEIACEKFPLAATVEDVLNALAELNSTQHSYQTVVIDSLDWLERLIWDAICREYRVTSIEKADGGYQRGYVHALTYWRKVTDALMQLRAKGIASLLIAHSKVEKFEDPESAAYDRYSPRLHKHASSLVVEWCDAVFFATRKFRTETEDKGFGRERTIAREVGKDGGERILRTVGGPSCVAKNRYAHPAEILLSWPAVMAGFALETPQPQGETPNGQPEGI
ncbi:MAG: ATP-binding protein [Planctomycetes bacterium]|nr:ATP-binding protein [Planctomycetota bacterium]